MHVCTYVFSTLFTFVTIVLWLWSKAEPAGTWSVEESAGAEPPGAAAG